MSQDLSKEDMLQCLKDANMYEDDMSDEMLAQYYKVVKNSETLAAEEQDKSLKDSVDELLEAINDSENIVSSTNTVKKNVFAPKQWSSQKKLNKEGNNNESQEVQKEETDDTVLDVIKSPIGFNDMPKSEKNPLKVISHELKCVNIQNSKKFLSSNDEIRVKMLYDYHVATAKFRSHLAKMSVNMVPLPKPLPLDSEPIVNPVIQSLKDEGPHEDLYVSRSGRHTKRKVYNEDDSSQEEVINKRSKNDEWISKSSSKTNKHAKKSDPVSSTSTTEKNVPETIVESENNEKNDKKTVSKPRTYHNKKLGNEEIMQRSSLFNDHKKRTETLVNAGIEEEQKRRKEEMKLEQFNRSLQVADMDENLDEIISVDDGEEFQKRRIVPSIPGRKPINTRKRKDNVEPLNITTTKKNVYKSPSRQENKPVNGVGKTHNTGASSSGSKQVMKANTIACPLCAVSFPKEEVEEHAATCGEEPITSSSTKVGKLSCEYCDLVVPHDMDYEVHIQQCKSKRNNP